jgi:SAM-dependent methyltransferase
MPSPDDTIGLLRCPLSGGRLHWLNQNLLVSENGAHEYKYEDGVFHLLAPLNADEGKRLRLGADKESTQTYYDTFGWQDHGGTYGEVRTFTDTRSTPWSYTVRCIRRVRKFIPRRGQFLLDAASGPIPYAEYMEFHEGFHRRVCIDLSIEALKEASRNLGPRGICILGDMTALPLADSSIDAAVSFHTIYHIPANEQDKAFEELHRVLRPRGAAAIVYSWGYSPITSRVLRLLDKLGLPDAKGPPAVGLYYHPHEKEWLFGRQWPFEFEVRAWRTLGSSVLQRLGDGWFLRFAYFILYELENIFPGFLGRHGQYPLILIKKK